MRRNLLYVVPFLLFVVPGLATAATVVYSVAGLVSAVRDGAEGATIEIAAGTYELDAPAGAEGRA